MKRCGIVLLMGLLALPLNVIGSEDKKDPPLKEAKKDPKKENPHFTISKETTYVTQPLDKDGRIDYAAALNERLGKGITKENNACVVLWQVLGPRLEDGKSMPPEYFKLIGIEAPPKKGDYFIDIEKYLTENLKLELDYGKIAEIYSMT